MFYVDDVLNKQQTGKVGGMKRLVAHCLCLVVLAVVILFNGPAEAEIIDAIVASVGNEVILRSELLNEIAPMLNELRKTALSEADFQQQAQDLLNRVMKQRIETKLLVREALLLGIEVDEDQTEKRFNDLQSSYPSSEVFLRELEASGLTARDLRARLEKQTMAARMSLAKRRQLESEVVVSETEVAQYYEDKKSDFIQSERVLVRQIFVMAKKDPDERAVARAKVEQLCTELEAGADFAELAKAYSDALGAEQGGIIGWKVRGDLKAELEDVVFSLPVGLCSDVLETQGGLHLLKVEQRKEEALTPLLEARKTIEPILRRQAALEQYAKWIAGLHKRSQVRVFM